MIGAITSILGLDDEDKMSESDVEKLIDQIVDPVGTFYMYGLPASLLRRKVLRGEKSND
jgi:F420-non-reducing hydrogenase small subunit